MLFPGVLEYFLLFRMPLSRFCVLSFAFKSPHLGLSLEDFLHALGGSASKLQPQRS
jgi:hypothetical protein